MFSIQVFVFNLQSASYLLAKIKTKKMISKLIFISAKRLSNDIQHRKTTSIVHSVGCEYKSNFNLISYLDIVFALVVSIVASYYKNGF